MILMYYSYMRTTITLDDDVYELASHYAAARGLTLGTAVGELVRRAESGLRSAPGSSRIRIASNGLPVFSARGRAITSEMVKDAQEDEIA